MYQIFISYRRDDSIDVTGRIYDRLVTVFGKENIFRDVDSIPLGNDFDRYLVDKVTQCKVLLAVIGKTWVNARLNDEKDFVRIELLSALLRGMTIIPLFVSNAKIPTENDLPKELHPLLVKNGISIRPDPDFHRDMNKLIHELENISTNKEVIPLLQQGTQNYPDGRYWISDQGVITDTKTGLEWLVGPDKDTTWDQAKDWVRSLNSEKFAGRTWRMPTNHELRGIYKPGKQNALDKHIHLDSIFKTTGCGVWSGDDEDNHFHCWFAWRVGLGSGRAEWFMNDSGLFTRGFVVCVGEAEARRKAEEARQVEAKKEIEQKMHERAYQSKQKLRRTLKMTVVIVMLLAIGMWQFPRQAKETRQVEEAKRKVEASKNRYWISDQGIITDTTTNLEWLVGPDTDTTWDQAKDWVKSLNSEKFAGRTWRMPAKHELQGIYEPGKQNALNIIVYLDSIFKTRGWWVWSGELYNEDPSCAWGINLTYGGEVGWAGRGIANFTRGFAVCAGR